MSALPITTSSPQWRVIGIGIAGLITVAALAAAHGWRMPILLGLGGLLGLVLYHTAFGFTAAYRRMIINRETAAVRAQLILIAAATLLFAPVLAEGRGFGIEAYSANAPVGMQVLIGAFMFGLGMQLGNGCGSGTLFTLGGGSIGGDEYSLVADRACHHGDARSGVAQRLEAAGVGAASFAVKVPAAPVHAQKTPAIFAALPLPPL